MFDFELKIGLKFIFARKSALSLGRKSLSLQRMKESKISPALQTYVEQQIIPRYAHFDKAHREEHVRMVIAQSMKLAAEMPELDRDMVYAIAAFHDLGLVNGREYHHIDSGKILAADEFIHTHFTPEQIAVMVEAVEDHRASNQSAPRSQYGLVVAEADRFIDPETIVRRTIQYSLAHYPELDREGHYRRSAQHIREKYGPEGYLKIWIPWSDNAARLDRLRQLFADEPQFLRLFNRLYDEECR